MTGPPAAPVGSRLQNLTAVLGMGLLVTHPSTLAGDGEPLPLALGPAALAFALMASLAGLALQVHRRRRAEAQARLALDQALHAAADLRLRQAAVDAAANAIILTDASGTILWVNRAFTAMTGYPAEEAVGATPRILRSGEPCRLQACSTGLLPLRLG